MGLIGDRKSKKAKEKEKEIERLKNGQNMLNKTKSPLKKGVMGGGGGGVMVGRYPAGYYTTPNPQSSSWAREGGHHPNQPRHQPHLNPRYQTWVAPRKQQSLSSLVSGVAYSFAAAHFLQQCNCNCRTAKYLGQISDKPAQITKRPLSLVAPSQTGFHKSANLLGGV